MHRITFISTIHRELGQCSTEELYKIIRKLNPEVVFLEAVDNTYSEYEKHIYSTYRVFHRKLEVSAIQKYSLDNSFEYVPVCEIGLSDAFHKKVNIVSQDFRLQKLIDHFNSLASESGFDFLNSKECVSIQEEMRALESEILNNNELDEIVKTDINAYEDPMIRNIYSFSNENYFSSAVFMCGAAHRKSIIEKINSLEKMNPSNLNWSIYGTL